MSSGNVNSNKSTSEYPPKNLYFNPSSAHPYSNIKFDNQNMYSFPEKNPSKKAITPGPSFNQPIRDISKHKNYATKRKEEENQEKNYIYEKCKNLNNFKILDNCGKGTFGEVMLIYNEHDKLKMAMKFHKGDDAIANLNREHRILEHLSNNKSFKLLTYYGPYKDDDKNKQIMLGIEAGEANLQEILQIRKKLSKPYTLEEVLYIMEILFQNLCEIHKLNIFHSDIKPSNVIVIYQNTSERTETEVTYKFTDFGASLLLSPDNNEIPTKSLLACTENYKPPDFGKNNTFNPWKFDHYSLAIVFNDLLTNITEKTESCNEILKLVKDYINCQPQPNRPDFNDLWSKIKNIGVEPTKIKKKDEGKHIEEVQKEKKLNLKIENTEEYFVNENRKFNNCKECNYFNGQKSIIENYRKHLKDIFFFPTNFDFQSQNFDTQLIEKCDFDKLECKSYVIEILENNFYYERLLGKSGYKNAVFFIKLCIKFIDRKKEEYYRLKTYYQNIFDILKDSNSEDEEEALSFRDKSLEIRKFLPEEIKNFLSKDFKLVEQINFIPGDQTDKYIINVNERKENSTNFIEIGKEQCLAIVLLKTEQNVWIYKNYVSNVSFTPKIYSYIKLHEHETYLVRQEKNENLTDFLNKSQNRCLANELRHQLFQNLICFTCSVLANEDIYLNNLTPEKIFIVRDEKGMFKEFVLETDSIDYKHNDNAKYKPFLSSYDQDFMSPEQKELKNTGVNDYDKNIDPNISSVYSWAKILLHTFFDVRQGKNLQEMMNELKKIDNFWFEIVAPMLDSPGKRFNFSDIKEHYYLQFIPQVAFTKKKEKFKAADERTEITQQLIKKENVRLTLLQNGEIIYENGEQSAKFCSREKFKYCYIGPTCFWDMNGFGTQIFTQNTDSMDPISKIKDKSYSMLWIRFVTSLSKLADMKEIKSKSYIDNLDETIDFCFQKIQNFFKSLSTRKNERVSRFIWSEFEKNIYQSDQNRRDFEFDNIEGKIYYGKFRNDLWNDDSCILIEYDPQKLELNSIYSGNIENKYKIGKGMMIVKKNSNKTSNGFEVIVSKSWNENERNLYFLGNAKSEKKENLIVLPESFKIN